MATAVQRVRDRLGRATAALETAGVPYAVVGESRRRRVGRDHRSSRGA